MKLENEILYVEMVEHGAELTRIYNKKTGAEILWNADPKFWKRHSPVLFPNVGKTWHNVVKIQGEQYPTSQHGFARDHDFKCIYAGKEEVKFLLTSTDEMKEVYPFDFELYISYRLKKNVIEVEWGIKNPSEETIYFTIGGHPAIHFAKENETKADYRLYFPEKDHLNYILVDIAEGGADPKKVYEMKLEDGYYPLTEELFERDALIFDENQIEEVWISHKDGTPYVGMKCEGFSNFGIWSVKDAPFVCLEPWMGRCDDMGFEGDISEKPGINSVESGGTFEKSYQIIVG